MREFEMIVATHELIPQIRFHFIMYCEHRLSWKWPSASSLVTRSHMWMLMIMVVKSPKKESVIFQEKEWERLRIIYIFHCVNSAYNGPIRKVFFFILIFFWIRLSLNVFTQTQIIILTKKQLLKKKIPCEVVPNDLLVGSSLFVIHITNANVLTNCSTNILCIIII